MSGEKQRVHVKCTVCDWYHSRYPTNTNPCARCGSEELISYIPKKRVHVPIKLPKKIGNWTITQHLEKYLYLAVCKCGTEKVTPIYSMSVGMSNSCGCITRKKAMARRTIHTNGYIMRYCPNGHPRSKSKSHLTKAAYIGEHILVMEKKLGRYLTEGEVVHHKNGIRNDNKISNLELWIKGHLPGQRVSDQVKWAEKLLRKYKPHLLKET